MSLGLSQRLLVRRRLGLLPLRVQFRFLAIAIALLAIILAVVGGASYGRAQADLTAIQHNSNKVVAAQTMAGAVHRIDALLPELLLQTKAGKSNSLELSTPVVEAQLARFEDALFVAYSNTTAGQPDAATVNDRLMPSFRSYREAVTGLLHGLRYGQVADADLGYKNATRILSEQLRPALLRLDRLDRQDIDQGALGARTFLTGAQGIVWGVGALLLVLLGYTTIRLARTTRRRLNPGLVPALVVAAVFVLMTGVQITRTRTDLQRVGIDSFESLHLSVQLQDELTAARAAQNAWLIDKEGALSHDLAFGHADRQIRSMLDLAIAAAQGSHAELEELSAISVAYAGFFKVDQELRTAYIQSPAAALSISSGKAQDGYQEAWTAIDRVRQGADDRFHGNLSRALGDLSSAQPLAWGIYLGIAALAVWGVGMRLKEF
jgi:hypothetical protein